MFDCCAKSHIYEHYIILYRKRKCFSHVFCDLAKLFAPQAKHNNMFARSVYVGENTSQPANVRAKRVRCSRMQSFFKKNPQLFLEISYTGTN